MAITNPNSSGQGYDADHTATEYHKLLVEFGWEYSHSTKIGMPSGQSYIHHTYTNHNVAKATVGVDNKPGPVKVGYLGSGKITEYYTEGLKRYLKRNKK